MELEEESWGNLVFVSTLGTWQNKAQISKAWGISVSGGPLYQNTKEITDLVDEGLIEKRGDTLYVNLQTVEFKELLEDHFKEKAEESGVSEPSTRLYYKVLDKMDEFLSFISKKEVKEEILSLDNVTRFYSSSKEAKKHPLKIFNAIISAITVYFSKKVIQKQLSGQQGYNTLFEAMLETAFDSTKTSIGPVVDSIGKMYEKDPDQFEFIESELREIMKDQLDNAFSQLQF